MPKKSDITRQGVQFLEGGKLSAYTSPLYLTLFIFMGGSALMFLAVLGLYLAQIRMLPADITRPVFPPYFILSTLIMIASAVLINKSRREFLQDNLLSCVRSLMMTAACGILFGVFQVSGWYQLAESGQAFDGVNNGVPYLYVLSGIHLFHLLLGMIWISVLIRSYYNKSRHIADALIIYTNPYEHNRLKMLSIYWHYTDIVWLVLFLSFFFTLSPGN